MFAASFLLAILCCGIISVGDIGELTQVLWRGVCRLCHTLTIPGQVDKLILQRFI